MAHFQGPAYGQEPTIDVTYWTDQEPGDMQYCGAMLNGRPGRPAEWYVHQTYSVVVLPIPHGLR